jgi:hypothetical protein
VNLTITKLSASPATHAVELANALLAASAAYRPLMFSLFPIGNAAGTVCLAAVVGFSLCVRPTTETNFAARPCTPRCTAAFRDNLRRPILRELSPVGDCQFTARDAGRSRHPCAPASLSRPFKLSSLKCPRTLCDLSRPLKFPPTRQRPVAELRGGL